MIFCNLAVSKQKLRPSERREHRIPNLRKALAVGRKLLYSIRRAYVDNLEYDFDFLAPVRVQFSRGDEKHGFGGK
jgi:hypothetical protein